MNTILVTVDALRADHLSQYGYGRDTMPVLDQLKHEGVWFEKAFANGPYTRISVPSFHTSRYLGYEEIHDTPTLAGVLAGNNVTTAGFGTQAGLDKVDVEGDLVFDTYVDFGQDSDKDQADRDRPLRDRIVQKIAQHRIMDNKMIHSVAKAVYDNLPLSVGNPVPTAGYTSAKKVTDGAIDWLDEREGGDFFLWIHYMEAHRPYSVHDDQPEFGDGEFDAVKLREISRKAAARPQAVSDTERRKLVDAYDSDIRYCSNHMERLIDELKKLDLWNETNILFSSDHGEGFGEHGHYFHRHQPYDELIHVPLIARGPDVPDRGAVCEQRELIDLMPTILDWHGVETTKLPLEGTNLFKSGSRKVMAVGSQRNHGAVVAGRWDGWKYLSIEDEERLYNLQSDPDEQVSVADKNPSITDQFRDEIPERLFEQEPEELVIPDDKVKREQLTALGYIEPKDK